LTGVEGSICDAWGAIAVSVVIIGVATSLIIEIVERARTFYSTKGDNGGRYSGLNREDEEEYENNNNDDTDVREDGGPVAAGAV
jgi:hypothetical protein